MGCIVSASFDVSVGDDGELVHRPSVSHVCSCSVSVPCLSRIGSTSRVRIQRISTHQHESHSTSQNWVNILGKGGSPG